MASLRDIFPAAHRHLLPAVFDHPEVTETRATCSDCAMCPRGPRAPNTIGFEPSLKCCTYHPTLPNFLVGAILEDRSPTMVEGRRRIEQRIASRVGVTPQWLAPPRKQRVLLEAARGSSFGRSKVLLCPYFIEGASAACSIWPHREAVCSTFFCKHDAGAVGDAVWMATKQLLGHIELTLSQAALREIAPDTTEPKIPRQRLTLEDLEDRPPNADAYSGYWGEWEGREEDLYRQAYAWVRALTKADLARLLADDPDDRGSMRIDDLQHRLEVLDRAEIPSTLIVNPAMHESRVPNDDGTVATTYSIFDSQRLSPDLLAIVHEFDRDRLAAKVEHGAPLPTVSQTLAQIQRERGVELPQDLLLALVRHEILIPPERSP